MTRGRNVLGEPLQCCCMDPLTGFTRSGWCETGSAEPGRHVICAAVGAPAAGQSRSSSSIRS